MNRLLLATALAFTLVSAQTLTEAAIAAAGGSAAGVAGKGVSDGLDKIFGKLSSMKTPAAVPTRPPVRTTAIRDASAGSSYAPVGSSVAPSREVLVKVAEGTRRDDLIRQTGSPACRIIMGEGSHVVELYNYAANGETIASIRLTDGEVTAVRLNGRR